jgi:hypothetical protein
VGLDLFFPFAVFSWFCASPAYLSARVSPSPSSLDADDLLGAPDKEGKKKKKKEKGKPKKKNKTKPGRQIEKAH